MIFFGGPGYYRRGPGGGFFLLILLLLLFGSPLIGFGLIVLPIIFGLICIYVIYLLLKSSISSSKTKSTNVNTNESAINSMVNEKELTIINSNLSVYFTKNLYLPLTDKISLFALNDRYKSIDDLYLTYYKEKVVLLKDLRREQFGTYEVITKALINIAKNRVESNIALAKESTDYYNDVIDRLNKEEYDEDPNTSIVLKPELSEVNDYTSFSNLIFKMIQNVNYGTNNASEYVFGHKKALKEYALEIKNNNENINLVEDNISLKINSIQTKSSLEDKGYYDGLLYVLKAIRKAKDKIYLKIREEVNDKYRIN